MFFRSKSSETDSGWWYNKPYFRTHSQNSPMRIVNPAKTGLYTSLFWFRTLTNFNNNLSCIGLQRFEISTLNKKNRRNSVLIDTFRDTFVKNIWNFLSSNLAQMARQSIMSGWEVLWRRHEKIPCLDVDQILTLVFQHYWLSSRLYLILNSPVDPEGNYFNIEPYSNQFDDFP